MVTACKGVAHGLLEIVGRWSFHNCINFGLTMVENVKCHGGQKKGGVIRKNTAPPHAVGFVLRSSVVPLRSRLSYTSAKVRKVLETTKTFRGNFAKKGKVSHEVGQKKGKPRGFPSDY